MKIYDAASADKYRISRTHGDLDYGHIIDEVIDSEIENNKQNKQESIGVTKRNLRENSLSLDFSSVLDSFKVKKELQPKIWQDNVMNSRVRLRLMDIADEFIEFINVPWVKPKDIILTGSLANYNWSKYSDFDLHILMDFKKVDERVEFVKEYFDSKKIVWNEQHSNLKIYGFPVELYVQDINEEHKASGIYSLNKNKWIKEPERDELVSIKLDRQTIKNKTLKYVKDINKLISNFNEETDTHKLEIISNKVKSTWDSLKRIRRESLKTGNELTIGNLIWKSLRRLGFLDKLFDLKAQAYDKIKSIK
jgi:predicted nucleotidyltransferase